jgi:Tol biopolymer transport system component
MRADGKEPRRLSVPHAPGSPGVFVAARLSPDGRRVACLHQKQGNQYGVWVLDRDGKGARQIVNYSTSWRPTPCWSPDGSRLALVDHDFTPDGRPTRFHLDVIDADGGNRRTLPIPPVLRMSAPDWR